MSGRLPHRTGAWRNNHRCAAAMLGDGVVGWLAVIGAIGRELADRHIDLVEQRFHLRGVAGILVGHDMSDDLAAVGIQRQMQLSPSPPRPGAVLLFQPLAGAVDLEPGAVDEDMDGPFSWNPATLPFFRRSPCACPTAQRRMIGHGEIQSHQLQHRCQQALRLAQPQAEHQAQRSGRSQSPDRNNAAGRRVSCVSALPPRQRLRVHPQRQTTTSAKTRLIFPPVRHLELHLADTMAAG